MDAQVKGRTGQDWVKYDWTGQDRVGYDWTGQDRVGY